MGSSKPVERVHVRPCKICSLPVESPAGVAGRPRETHIECKYKYKRVNAPPLEVIIPDDYNPRVDGLNNTTRAAIRRLIQKPAKRRAFILERMERGMKYYG